MMHCQRVQRLIGVYRELDRAEARMVDAHLRECSSCQAAWAEEQRVRKYLAAIPVLDVPRHLQPQLLAIPATVAATPSLLAILMRLLGVLILGLGLGSIASDRPNNLPPTQPEVGHAENLAGSAPLEAALDFDEREPATARLAVAPRPAPVSRDSIPALHTPQPTPALESPAYAMSSARDDRDEDDAKRDRAQTSPPTLVSSGIPDVIPAVETAPADGSPPTLSVPTPTTASCGALTVVLYADVGIEGTSMDDCVVCDGQLGPADRSAWLESNHILPDGLQLTIQDSSTGAPLFSERIAGNGQALISVSLESVDHPWICEQDRVRLQLGMPENAYDEGWQACPRGPGHQLDLTLSERRSAAFGLTRACPTHPEPPAPEPSDEAPEPEPTSTATAEPSAIAPEPSQTQPPAPTPAPTQATEEPDPEPGPGSGNAPDPEPGPPSGAPSPTPPGGEDPPPPPPDPPTPKPEPTTPGPVPPPPTDL